MENADLLIEKHFISWNIFLWSFEKFFAVDSHGPHTTRSIHAPFAKHTAWNENKERKMITKWNQNIASFKIYRCAGPRAWAAVTCFGFLNTKRSKNRAKVKSCNGSPVYSIDEPSAIVLANNDTYLKQNNDTNIKMFSITLTDFAYRRMKMID